MTISIDRDHVAKLLERNRYLVLSTCDGGKPWAATLEYVLDDNLDFYFFSTGDCLHAQHIAANANVAVAVFDSDQPAYTSSFSGVLNGVQIEATARLLDKSEYPDAVVAGIEALEPPMPPYEVFKIETSRFHVPVIEDGVNERIEVDA